MSNEETIGQKCLKKYPDKIPVVVYYKDISFSDPNSVEAKKNTSQLIVPAEVNIGFLMTLIRKKAKISHIESIFLFIDGKIPCSTDVLSQVYENHKNKRNDCLEIIVTKENSFGKN